MGKAHSKSHSAFFLVVIVAIYVLSFEWIERESLVYLDRLPRQYPMEWVHQKSKRQSFEIVVLSTYQTTYRAAAIFSNKSWFHSKPLLFNCLPESKLLSQGLFLRLSSPCYAYCFNIPHSNVEEDHTTSSTFL